MFEPNSGIFFSFLEKIIKQNMSAKVFIANRESNADYNVFFVDRDSQQMNHQLIAPGELVDRESNANVKVFIVDRESNADIKITRGHFPKPR